MYIEKAKTDMLNAQHYGKIIENMEYGERHNSQNNISDEQLVLMGFDKSYSELVKFIPRIPLQEQYVSCDFATYGKCPSCMETVTNGIGGKDVKCRHCGQLLKW